MDVLAAGGFTMMADALKMNNLSDINGIFHYKHGYSSWWMMTNHLTVNRANDSLCCTK